MLSSGAASAPERTHAHRGKESQVRVLFITHQLHSENAEDGVWSIIYMEFRTLQERNTILDNEIMNNHELQSETTLIVVHTLMCQRWHSMWQDASQREFLCENCCFRCPIGMMNWKVTCCASMLVCLCWGLEAATQNSSPLLEQWLMFSRCVLPSPRHCWY